MNQRFDVLVVGAGPAGIAAAVTAAEAGRRVGLIDDNPAPGGQIWRSGAPRSRSERSWQARLEASSVVRLQGWRVFDAPEPNLLRAERTLLDPDGTAASVELRCDKLILATGARERFLPFPGWTLPNVMGAGGLDAMVRGGLPIAGKRVVVAGTGPLLLAVAAHIASRGARIVAICEQAPLARLARFATRLLADPAKLWQGVRYRIAAWPAPFHTGCWPVAAHGDGRLESVTLRRGARTWDLACDLLACGFHLVPNTGLAALLGCRLDAGFVATDETLQTSIPGVYCAGEPTGIGGVELSLLEGQIAALAACGASSQAARLARRRQRKLAFVRALAAACVLNPQLRSLAHDDTIVCRCEDVPCRSLRPHPAWRDAKLHTRCGMGPCQGRICGPAAEFLFGWHADSVRPPVFPARVASLAAAGGAQPRPESVTLTSTFSPSSQEAL